MQPTQEQSLILNAFKTGDNLVIEAGAGCLSADTIVNLKRASRGFKCTIEYLVMSLNGVAEFDRIIFGKKIKQKTRGWDLSIKTKISIEDNGLVKLGTIKNAWFSGEKETFLIKTKSGKSIRATKIHPFLTSEGWKNLEELKIGDLLKINSGRSSKEKSFKTQYKSIVTKFHPNQVSDSNKRIKFKIPLHRAIVEAKINNLSLNDFIFILRNDEEKSKELNFLTNEFHVHHIDENSMNNNIENLEVINKIDHAKHHSKEYFKNVLYQIGNDQIISIEYFGLEKTYDIEIEEENHNFLANDIVVHNTGKTSALRFISQCNSSKKGLYLAFNKSIADEAQTKFDRSVLCKTAHSLAYAVVGKNYRERLNAGRVKMSDIAKFLGVNDDVLISEKLEKISAVQISRIAVQTVDRFCYSADLEINGFHVPKINGIESIEDKEVLKSIILPLAKKAWADLIKPEGILKFNHDYYLKIWAMSNPKLNYDYILLDEAQDTNAVLSHIISSQKYSQLILVGDRCQSIYQWRGALDCMSDFEGKRLFLSQSFRFGQEIADEANKWLEYLNADLRLKGCDIKSSVEDLNKADAILCRTNGKCIEMVSEEIDCGHKVALVGGGESIKKMAEASITLKAGIGTTHSELFAFKNWDELQEYSATDEGQDLKPLVMMIDKYGADGVIDICNKLSEEKNADVVVSTCHKSKGKEWGSVRIADDFSEPQKTEKNPNPKIEKSIAMLAYVAVTRAKYKLDCSSISWIEKFI